MSNRLYTNYANLLLGAGVHALPDWDTDTIKLHLVDAADHTVDLANHQDEADIANAGIVATGTLASVTISGGVVDAADLTLSSVTGDESEELHIWEDTGTDTTSPLMVYIDTATAGLPVTPNSGDIDVIWNASGIVSLVA